MIDCKNHNIELKDSLDIVRRITIIDEIDDIDDEKEYSGLLTDD